MIVYYILFVYLFFSLIWSVCCTTDEDGRKKLDTYIREKEGVFPIKDTIYEYFVDYQNFCFSSWESKLPYGWRYEPWYKTYTIKYWKNIDFDSFFLGLPFTK